MLEVMAVGQVEEAMAGVPPVAPLVEGMAVMVVVVQEDISSSINNSRCPRRVNTVVVLIPLSNSNKDTVEAAAGAFPLVGRR